MPGGMQARQQDGCQRDRCQRARRVALQKGQPCGLPCMGVGTCARDDTGQIFYCEKTVRLTLGMGLIMRYKKNSVLFASLLGLVLMVFVIVGTFRRWSELMGIKTLVTDSYGEPVRQLAEEYLLVADSDL